MCGIAGIVNFSYPEKKDALLCSMLGLIKHRGPDACGIYTSEQTGLGHIRLSIIDFHSGIQPIHNEDRTVWVIFNGEIFNYPELREKLVSKGHKFYTETDTEILVHSYEDLGADLFDDLNGQFAFALWDQKRQRLLLGRDRFGICPLFYHHFGGRLVFSSEIKGIFADKSISRSLDHQTLSDIFTCWAPMGSGSAFKTIHQIPPGHYALFSKDGMKVKRYWQLSFNKTDSEDRTLSELSEELGHLLCDATRIRLRADVPVGAYLSGGLDSTFLSALGKQSSNNQLKTFSVSFTDKRFDEMEYQIKAVDSLRTEHKNIRCTEKDIGSIFPQVIWHAEVPILRTAPAPLYQLSRLVHENNFKVVLTGEGADEIFAGYNIFREDRVRRFWARDPSSRLRPLLIKKLYPYIFSEGKGNSAFLERFFRKSLNETDSPGYSHLLRWQNTSHLHTFFSEELQRETSDLGSFLKRFSSMLPPDFMSWHPLSRAQYTECMVFLPGYLLSSQGDRMTMAHSVEGRFPYLDHRVVEFASRVPPRYRINGLKSKFILKQAARDVIPPELVQREKQPYRAPISESFLGKTRLEYVDELLSMDNIKRSGYFDPKKVSGLLKKCMQQNGQLLSERENMGLVGILSTQLLDYLYLQNFPSHSAHVTPQVSFTAQ